MSDPDGRWVTGDGGMATSFEGPFTLGTRELAVLGATGTVVVAGSLWAIGGGSLGPLGLGIVALAMVAWVLEHTTWTWLAIRRDRVQVRSIRAMSGASRRALARRVRAALHDDPVDVEIPLAEVVGIDPTYSGIAFTLADGTRTIVVVPKDRRADVLAALLSVWARAASVDEADSGAREAMLALRAGVGDSSR